MSEWTAGKMFVAALGATGAGLLVRKAWQAFRGPASTSDQTSQLPAPPPAPPAPPRPASSTRPPLVPPPDGGGNWWGQMRFGPLVERWRPEVTARAGDLPVDPLLRWIEMESGGDMDSRGMPNREIGIWQLDYPGDGKKFGGSFAQLEDIARRSNERSNPFDLSWLSDEELDVEVGAGIRMITAARNTVRRVLGENGIAWPESSFDFGTAIKQIHATPAVITELLPKITKREGRPPANWKELHRLVNEFPIDQMSGVYPAGHKFAGKPYGLRLLALAPSKHGLKNRLEDTLRNAEEFGKVWAKAMS